MTATTITHLPTAEPPDHDPDHTDALHREITALRLQVARLAHGADYLHPAQVDHLLRPINPKRVSEEGGMAHLEAYDVRRVLISLFGFGRWSGDVLDSWQLYEHITNTGTEDKPYHRVSVGYRVRYRLTVCAPNGTVLATYTEEACGDATNFPINKRGDAHDFAVKTAESQALKRCAVNLGDPFGLSLYNKGSRNALVVRTLIDPRQDPVPLSGSPAAGPCNTAGPGVDEHITEPLAPEAPALTEDDPRVTNSLPDTLDPAAAAPPPGAAGGEPVSGGEPTPPTASPAVELYQRAVQVRSSDEPLGTMGRLLTDLMAEATSAGLTKERVNGRTLRTILIGMLGDVRREMDQTSGGAGDSDGS